METSEFYTITLFGRHERNDGSLDEPKHLEFKGELIIQERDVYVYKTQKGRLALFFDSDGAFPEWIFHHFDDVAEVANFENDDGEKVFGSALVVQIATTLGVPSPFPAEHLDI